MNPIPDRQYNIIKIDLTNIYLVIRVKDDTPWSLTDVHEDQYERFAALNEDFHCSAFPALAYVSIVENSWINNKLLRSMGIVPVKNSSEWAFQFYKPAFPR